MSGLGFGVWDLGFGIWSLGRFGVESRLQGFGFLREPNVGALIVGKRFSGTLEKVTSKNSK